jgi:hypothetical protein
MLVIKKNKMYKLDNRRIYIMLFIKIDKNIKKLRS